MEVVAKRLMGTHKVYLRPFLLVALSALLGTSMLAQSAASLSGTVSDATAAVVVNTKAVATNQATGIESVPQTDTAGAHLFPSLPIGGSRIQATAPCSPSA